MSRARREQKQNAIKGVTTCHVIRVVESMAFGESKIDVLAPTCDNANLKRILTRALNAVQRQLGGVQHLQSPPAIEPSDGEMNKKPPPLAAPEECDGRRAS